RRHTRSLRDWSSDVCSSDLNAAQKARDAAAENANPASSPATPSPTALDEACYQSAPVPLVVNESFARKYLENKNPVGLHMGNARSEERRVGKEWRPGG